jgi:alkaline phosphatase D
MAAHDTGSKRLALAVAAVVWGVSGPANAAVPVVRRWLGPEYWANRLQDWHVKDGRIECIAFMPWLSVRTATLLTHEVKPGPGEFRLTMRTGRHYTENFAGDDANGWSGFLIGIGQGRLDHRAAAIVHGLSGQGGGIQGVFGLRGGCTFREHSDEDHPTAYGELPCRKTPEQTPYVRSLSEDARLTLVARPDATGSTYTLTLTATDEKTGQPISEAVLEDVPEIDILGGIALLSHPAEDRGHPQIGNQFWFCDVKVSGTKIATLAERAWGPIVGVLYSLNETVLRATVQFMPTGVTARLEPRDYVAARFEYRPAGSDEGWARGPTARIATPSQTALLRIEPWDASKVYDYRAIPIGPDGADGGAATWYRGVIRRDPKHDDELVIAGFTGCYAVGRPFDYELKPRPFEQNVGRFTPEQIWVPCPPLLRSVAGHDPDLLVFTGDQIYEDAPTLPDPAMFPAEDFLYKWLHWLHSFRELTDRAPTIVMIDDHDVYQGNLWGWSGRPCPSQDPGTDGGYWKDPRFVNMVERCQSGHNPDPVDAAPIERGIGVYFTAFRYGGVHFAVLEDRKFKTPPGVPDDQGQLLGSRQEAFLERWAKDRRPNEPRIVLSQTALASVHTSWDGTIVRDADSNGRPKHARDRAVSLLAQAGAIGLAGDTHLAMVLRNLTDNGAGLIQFMVPAVGSRYQRWWEPAEPADTSVSPPIYVDPFGNRVQVLASGNARISYAELRKRPGPARLLVDRRLTKNGYGIVRVNKRRHQYVLECWPWDRSVGGGQYEGWPVVVPFPTAAAR